MFPLILNKYHLTFRMKYSMKQCSQFLMEVLQEGL